MIRFRILTGNSILDICTIQTSLQPQKISENSKTNTVSVGLTLTQSLSRCICLRVRFKVRVELIWWLETVGHRVRFFEKLADQHNQALNVEYGAIKMKSLNFKTLQNRFEITENKILKSTILGLMKSINKFRWEYTIASEGDERVNKNQKIIQTHTIIYKFSNSRLSAPVRTRQRWEKSQGGWS